jgi:hypothetical protein
VRTPGVQLYGDEWQVLQRGMRSDGKNARHRLPVRTSELQRTRALRFEAYLGIAILLTILSWCVRFLLRRDILVQLLFLFAAVSYLVRHFTGSRTV